jgi:hypothetical protein
MSYDTDYVWVVICKNRRFHHKDNTSYEHRILLGEADPFCAPPALDGMFHVRCDTCAEEYTYKSTEVLRAELSVPGNFTPHPLFRT